MERRNFCKCLAMTAASAGIPSYAQSSSSDHPELPEGFNRYTQDYAAFCALPPERRVFYKVSDGKIVQTKLDMSARLALLIQRNRIALPSHLLALELAVYPIANPPYSATRDLLPHSRDSLLAFPGHLCSPD